MAPDASNTGLLVPLLVLLPFAGFLVNGLLGKRINSETASGVIGSAAVGGSFAIAAVLFAGMTDGGPRTVQLFTWIAAGKLSCSVSYQVDPLSLLMTLVVTGVGFLIHVYSIGYMHGDRGFWRFFAYLNLFLFMMLNLVLADNFLLMFLGWEGVGLCSFLLIGFWHARPFDTGGYAPGTATAADAAKKAFIVNRIGDFGFLLAMFLIFGVFGSLTFEDVFARAAATLPAGGATATAIALLLFLGATGKSAQIPLYVWLPDAMAGPTPVSALIHAATMVTAGVYMVARCSVLYALAPAAMSVVAGIGLATAIIAGTMGLVQNDIKKILAYSTVSQLGFMFLGLGVGAFASGIFHLMTHAFFKALLFLGAGAVIHALRDEQDIRAMGGLKQAMPAVYATFLVGALAISGIPPLSGFFSKDEILWQAYARGSTFLWAAAWLAAGLTALYMFRLVFLTFSGASRRKEGGHAHDAPAVMRVPLIVLAALSAAGGLAGVPAIFGGSNRLERWLAPVFERADLLLPPQRGEGHAAEVVLAALSVAAAAGGIALAALVTLKRPELADRAAATFRRIAVLFRRGYFVDELYDRAVVRPIVRGSEKLLWRGFDSGVIDRLVDGAGEAATRAAGLIRRVQTGVAQRYAFALVAGIVLVLWMLVLR